MFEKRHFWQSFTQKYLKITLILEKRTLFSQILQGAASDYRMLISFGLFLAYFICIYYTSVSYYTFIKNIYDPISYFKLALLPPHCLHDGELFKISHILD